MNKISFLKSYFFKHLFMILAFLVFVLTMLVSFVLFRINLKTVLYPLVLSICLSVFIVLFDIKNEYKRYLILRNIQLSIEDTIIDLPKNNNVVIKEYERIIRELLIEKKDLKQALSSKYDDLLEYYTTWTHQIKIPLASLKLKLSESNDDNNVLLYNSDLNRIEQYVQMAISYLKLDNNDIDFVFHKYDLDELIKPVIRKFSNDFIIKKLSLDYIEANKQVLTDDKWFSFAFEQIISNSIKYTNEGSISIYLENDSLYIKDTGIGISDHDLPRLFEKGYTGLNGRSHKNASGLGLYLAKKIFDKLAISISIDSVINKGTIVKLTFNNKKIKYE